MEREEHDMDAPASIMTPTMLHQLKTPPMIDEAKKAMQEHGCNIVEYVKHCMVLFPEGTMRVEIYPRLYNERYTITLPDGFQIREMYDRCQEQSLLFLLQLNTSIEVEAS
jgi:hypothetical protein